MGYVDKGKVLGILRHLCNVFSEPPMDNEDMIKLKLAQYLYKEFAEYPTADVVEVVRCEDCQHKEQCPESLIIEGKDKYLVFCSCGEKRDGNKHAHWEYWSGWAGNHDQRIEDATCSNCGYKHPTVRLDYVDGKFIKGYVPDKLAKECPKCGAKMRGDNK